MASKAARANVALANMRRKNETLEKAISAVRRAAKNETAQLLTAGAVSGGVGAVVGSKVQEYLNTKGVEAGKTVVSAPVWRRPSYLDLDGRSNPSLYRLAPREN